MLAFGIGHPRDKKESALGAPGLAGSPLREQGNAMVWRRMGEDQVQAGRSRSLLAVGLEGVWGALHPRAVSAGWTGTVKQACNTEDTSERNRGRAMRPGELRLG